MAADTYSVVLADPPWHYRNFSSTLHGAAAAVMETMKPEEIAAVPVGRWAAADSVLLLWATWPQLVHAQEVIRAWGFKYVTGMPWVKTCPSSGDIRRGVGFWTMAASEMLLVATRGKSIRHPAAGGVGKPIGLLHDEPRCFWAPRSAHSTKPPEVHEWIEQTLPGPYLELFARSARPGWTCWGLDLGQRLGPDGVTVSSPRPGVTVYRPGAAPICVAEEAERALLTARIYLRIRTWRGE